MSILDLFSLHGQVAVVTGASRGIGQGLAVALAEAGADLAVTATGDCAETCARIHALGRECVAIAADLGQPDAPARVIDAALTSYGRIDILVNNAGIIRRAPFLDFSSADWDEVMAVNSTAVFKLSQAAARGMAARRRGKIINLASMLSFQGGIRVPSYTASKSAVMGLTRLMACELGPLGINTNAIAPGYIATDNTAPLRADAARNQAILERIPAGRWGTPEDLAGAVVYLASRASDYLNGHTLAVDGGWLAR
jgi:2-dehydro-3-deoxy-D-gluconate 5-dehydrogenase